MCKAIHRFLDGLEEVHRDLSAHLNHDVGGRLHIGASCGYFSEAEWEIRPSLGDIKAETVKIAMQFMQIWISGP